MTSRFRHHFPLSLHLFAIMALFAGALAALHATPLLEKEAVVEVADSTSSGVAEIAVVPAVLQLRRDTSMWVFQKVRILNRGSAPLNLSKVTASCGCAAATVLKNPIHPLEVGEMAIRINTSNLHDSLNLIEFKIESNAKLNPYMYKVYVIDTSYSAAKSPKN